MTGRTETLIAAAAAAAIGATPAAAMDLNERQTTKLWHEHEGPRREAGPLPFSGSRAYVTAFGRRASADSQFHRDELRTAITMGKTAPGYPQPALVTMRLRIAM